MEVRLATLHGLYAILRASDGMWLAGFCTGENRAMYLVWNPGWEVVG